MKVIIKEDDYKAVENLLTKDEAERLGSIYHLRSGRGKMKIDISRFSDKTLEKLHKFLEEKATAGDGSARLSKGIIQQWREIKKDPAGQTVTKLENVESAMTEFIRPSEHKWLFQGCEDSNMVPWFVSRVKYNPPNKYRDASVSINLLALNADGCNHSRSRGDDEDGKTISVCSDDYRKKTMSEILEKKGYFLETPERVESYEDELERYIAHCDEDGFQMSVTGKVRQLGGWGHDAYCPAEKSGRAAKMVVDPAGDAKGRQATTSSFWSGKDEDDDAVDGDLFQLPTHPIVRMFDLDNHENYRVNVNNMEPYEYDTEVGKKLVLPNEVKDLLEILIEYAQAKFVDIVSGKEGGTIILLEGPPGIGKTLSAEVYAEVMQKPLYKVQSSQLGISPKALEEQLQKVLERAERWGAILLIDEADVYIHERGKDIVQNAIVGVFLRVLEYYRGVLFMTTNRGTIIDDAIVSRLTARFRYKTPNQDDQEALWKILSSQNNIDLPAAEIPKLLKLLPGVSGRDIKNLLKLAYVVSSKKQQPITADMVKFLSGFRQTQGEEKDENDELSSDS
jgi:hypothetical protein